MILRAWQFVLHNLVDMQLFSRNARTSKFVSIYVYIYTVELGKIPIQINS